jgi:HPt (histidine-containing phosphotransfer) domain-containing protein
LISNDQVLNRKFIERFRRTGGATLVAEIIEIYLADQDSLIGQIRDALAQQDPAQLQDRADALKGCSANLGAVAITSLCEELERLGTAGDLAQAAGIVAMLETEAATVSGELALERTK